MNRGIVGRTVGERSYATSAPSEAVAVFIVSVVDHPVAVVVYSVADLGSVLTRLAFRGHAMHARGQAWIFALTTRSNFAFDDQ
jgi:hypothetical protein